MSRTDLPGAPVLPSSDAAAVLWPNQAPSDLRAFLDRNSGLRGDKDAALDLAYDEYCQLIEGGETPDP